MAGSPQKRARLEAQERVITELAGSSEIAEALLEDCQQHPTRSAKSRISRIANPPPEPRGPRGWKPQLGPLTRNAMDSATAGSLNDLAEHLKPGLRARISRMRPTWAKGWLEDQQIETTDLAGLLEYLASEHGGTTYSITVLSVEGRPIYTGTQDIASPVRRRGKVVDRDEWEGIAKTLPLAAIPAAQTDGALVLYKELMLMERERHKSEMEAQTRLMDSTRSQIETVLKASLAARAEENRANNPLEQILQARKTIKAVDGLMESIRPPALMESKQEPDDDGLAGLAKSAMKDFIGNVIVGQRPPASVAPISTAPIPDAILDDHDRKPSL